MLTLSFHLRRSPHKLASLAGLLTLTALSSCGTPFSAAPECKADGGDCDVSSGSVSAAGGAAAGEADVVTSQAGRLSEGGTTVTSNAGGEAGAEPATGGTSATGGTATSGGAPPIDAPPTSCQDAHKRNPALADGDVTIDPDGNGPVAAFAAHCDMTSDNGGWTEIGVGEYWQKNDIHLAADAVLPWAELTALIHLSEHVFRAGDGVQRLYIKDEGALVEKLSDPAGSNSLQAFLWRSKANALQCGTSYVDVAAGKMTTVTTKEVSCEPLGFGKHTCGMAAGWILFHRNDTTNWSGQNPCALKMVTGGTPVAPTMGSLRPLWLR